MDWIKNLPPEDFIYMIGGLLTLVLVIIILFKVCRTSREIAGRTLTMTEEIMSLNEQFVTNLKVVNRSYIDNEITEVGMIYRKDKVVLIEEQTRINARNKFEHVVSHQEIRELLKIDNYKIKKLKFYYENSIGTLIKSTGRVTRKKMQKELTKEKKELRRQEKLARIEQKRKAKEDKRNAKIEQKAKRYAEGNYTAGDRFVIFFENLFRPIKRARHNSVIKRNKKIADRRAEKEIEAEREKLIEAQKLIYEQQLRELKKEELREEYKINELKATLEEAEKENELGIKITPSEEVLENKKDKKPKKQEKKLDEEKPLAEEKKLDEKATEEKPVENKADEVLEVNPENDPSKE